MSHTLYDALQSLREEHETILLLVEALEALADKMASVSPAPFEQLEEAQVLLHRFLDGCHHRKEEELLFPELERHGVPRLGGPIGVMLAEHAEGRILMGRMDIELNLLSRPDGAPLRWARAARAFANLIGRHIAKEDSVLFPMAERLLAPAEHRRLSEAFERFERETFGANEHELLRSRCERLCDEVFGEVGPRDS